MTLSPSARLLGGSGILGEWHCAMCNRRVLAHQSMVLPLRNQPCGESETMLGGCAQGQSQPSKGSGKGIGVGKGIGGQPHREQSHPGRPIPATPGPQLSRAPTFHAPRPNQRRRTEYCTSSARCLAPSGGDLGSIGLLSGHYGPGEIQSGGEDQNSTRGSWREREDAARTQNESKIPLGSSSSHREKERRGLITYVPGSRLPRKRNILPISKPSMTFHYSQKRWPGC